jgi:hypothetical protein
VKSKIYKAASSLLCEKPCPKGEPRRIGIPLPLIKGEFGKIVHLTRPLRVHPLLTSWS